MFFSTSNKLNTPRRANDRESLLHYEVLKEVGQGGMGVVYMARDSRLGRTVALKVLPPETKADNKRRQRFLREARAAAALNHPNIVALYDIGSDRNTDFIAMEYVEGESLQSLLQPAPLAIPNVLSYAHQIASALTKAHSAGVVHRDLKPGNVMITPDGQVKLLDFGLAQLNPQHSPSESENTETLANLSVVGAIQGTVAYMSPEQAMGETVDLRSDVFSFGVVLYEMLSGERPFHGSTSVSLLHAIAFQQPAPIEKLRADIPTALQTVINKCLHKDREQRYQSMEPVAAELAALKSNLSSTSTQAVLARSENPRRAWLYCLSGAAISAGVAIGGWTYFHRVSTKADAEAPELVRRGYQYLLRYDKAGYKDLATRTFQKAVTLDPNNAAAYAGLADAYALQHAGNPDGQLLHLATSNANRAIELNPLLSAAHESMGSALIEERKYPEAETELRRALQLDPNNVDAQINLGDCLKYQNRAKESEDVYRKLIAAHPDDWRGYTFLASLLIRNGRQEEAVPLMQRAGSLVSDNVTVYRLLGQCYIDLGRDLEAVAALQKALALRPTASVYSSLGVAYFYAGRYQDAVTAFKGAVSQSANDFLHWANLGDAYRFTPGNEAKMHEAYGQAIRLVEDRLRKTPDSVELQSRLILYLSEDGQKERARTEIRKLTSHTMNAQSLYSFAVANEFLGDRDAAVKYLGEAAKSGFTVAQMNRSPDLIALRRNPRYHLEVLARARAAKAVPPR